MYVKFWFTEDIFANMVVNRTEKNRRQRTNEERAERARKTWMSVWDFVNEHDWDRVRWNSEVGEYEIAFFCQI